MTITSEDRTPYGLSAIIANVAEATVGPPARSGGTVAVTAVEPGATVMNVST